MCLVSADERLLYRALELARAAEAFASPNPAVGCVLVRNGVLLGEGAHRYEQRDHAEIVALKDAAARGHDVGGATAYVTLEPCSHHGRTGPCADALAAAGIARCVIATVDPNPLVRRKGIAKLRFSAVEVAIADPGSAVAQAARHLTEAFASSIQHARPFLHLKAAVSADGKLAPSPRSRIAATPYWITGPQAREDVQQLRHRADALLTGVGTVLADNPSLTDRSGLARRRPLLRVVLDSSLRTPLDSELVLSARADLLLVASATASIERERQLQERGIEVIRLPGTPSTQSLPTLFADVLHTRGMRSVLVEAGSRLNGSLLGAGLVDRLTVYTGPLKLGPEAMPFALGQPGPVTWESRLTGATRTHFTHGPGEDLCVSGYLHDPWKGVDTPSATVLMMPQPVRGT